jgi:ATP-dependent Clp protease ATP-binding subunit ClpA
VLERFGDSGKRLLVDAARQARALDHAYLGTEHLLLGMLAMPGSGAVPVLAGLGVDLDRVHAGRRRLARPCLDWTERRPHLGGVLGDALLDALVGRGLLARQEGTRALRVTPLGQAELPGVLEGGWPDTG